MANWQHPAIDNGDRVWRNRLKTNWFFLTRDTLGTGQENSNDLNLPWAANLPDYLTFEINGWQTLLTHDIADVPADLDSKIKLVITGHSHKPCIQWHGDCLYLNPGSAGRRRFKLPVTLALLDVSADTLPPQLVHLLDSPA